MNHFVPVRRMVLIGLLLFSLVMSVVVFAVSFRTFESEGLAELSAQARFAAGTLAGNLEWELAEDQQGDIGYFITQQVTRPYLRLAAFVAAGEEIVVSSDLHLKGQRLSATSGVDMTRVDAVRRTLIGEVYEDADGQLWAIYPVRLQPVPGEVRALRPGVLLMRFDPAPLRAQAVGRSMQFGLLLLLPYLLLTLAFAVMLKHRLTDRIERLLALARSQADGTGAVPLPVGGRDELGMLERELSALMRRLIDARDHNALLLDRIPNPIWACAADGLPDFFNAAWLAFSGHSQDEERGHGWETGIHAEDRPRVQRELRAAIEARLPCQIGFRLLHADGSYRPVQLYGEPVPGCGGEFHGYLASCFDRQREQQALERVAVSEARFRGLVEHSMVAVYLVQDGRMLYCNPRLAELTGYTQDELLGHPISELIAPEDLEMVRYRLSERQAGRYTGAYELQVLRRDGTRFPVELHGNRIEIDGRAAVIGMGIDISARSEAQQALAAAREVVEASPTVLFRWSPPRAWEILYVSDNVERWGPCLGQRLRTGQSFVDYIDLADRERVQTEVEHAIAAGTQELALEFRLTGQRCGERLWVESLCRILRTTLGDVVRLEGLVTDISARKLAELALRESEARFRATFEQAAAGVAHMGLDGRFLRVNERFCRMFGYAEPELLSRTGEMVTLPEDLEYTRENLAPLVRGEDNSASYEKRYLRKDGSVLWVYLSVSLLRDAAGAPAYLIVVAEDISARKHAEAELRRLNTELERRVQARTSELEHLNQELETFAYSVSHDLKAPLRGIDGYSHLLLEDYAPRLDDQGQGYLRRIRRGVIQMGCLIDDLLAYARLDRRVVRNAEVSLPTVVREVLAERRGDIEELHAEVSCTLPDLHLHCDREGLALVLRNLFDNALKYSHDAAPPRIDIVADLLEDRCRIDIHDNGIGFDMRYYDRIFEIFQRLSPAESYPGTGVGLAIVRKAVSRMGGRVWAESVPGDGACFHLELPLDGRTSLAPEAQEAGRDTGDAGAGAEKGK